MKQLQSVQSNKENVNHCAEFEAKIICYRIIEYPSPELFERIVAFRWKGDPNSVFMLCDTLSGGKWFSDSFSVVAKNAADQIVGYVSFIQNEIDSAKWFMANMGVMSTCRRMGIASQMIKIGLERLTDIGSKQLYSSTEPSNTASLALHEKFGFIHIPTEPFNGLDLSDQNMFRFDVPTNLGVTSMLSMHIMFVRELLDSPGNKAALNPAELSFAEWKIAFERNLSDLDEANFIIRRGIIPVAWLKINGLLGSDTVWISMLVVHERYQHHGVGSFAIRYAEDFAKARGFTVMSIHANIENAPALNCYKKAGYVITEEGDCTNGDGSRHKGYTLSKIL